MSTQNPLQHWLAEAKQQALTHLANRSFKRNPRLLDRLAGKVIAAAAGPVEADTDLDIPPYLP